eukprot:scaffold80953_cov45-Prasinocladus_malaysianus.AAC.1
MRRVDPPNAMTISLAESIKRWLVRLLPSVKLQDMRDRYEDYFPIQSIDVSISQVRAADLVQLNAKKIQVHSNSYMAPRHT